MEGGERKRKEKKERKKKKEKKERKNAALLLCGMSAGSVLFSRKLTVSG